MNNGLNVILEVFCLLGFFVFFAYVLVDSAKTDNQYQHELFSIWQKVNPATQLTYDEWQKLKSNDLLGR